MEKISLTLLEVSKITSIGIGTIRHIADTDPSFPVFKIGNKAAVPIVQLREWVAQKSKYRDSYPVINK